MQRQAASGERTVQARIPLRGIVSALAVALGVLAGPSMTARAQGTPGPKDDALDSLLEKLSEPSDQAGKPAAKPSKKEAEKDGGAAKPKEAGPKAKEATKARGDKPQPKKPGAPSTLSQKDKELDELLEKLGETTETPAPEERRGGGGGEKPEPGPAGPKPDQKPDQKERDRLTGKDKETDQHLEELAGRKRRKKDDEERSGAAGQLIKEMREIEQRLSKPDTGESTRQEQKQVVKRIETLIEQARQSGSSSMRMRIVRQRRQQGQRPGQQQGQTDGALAQGTGPTKPLKPPSKHSTAGGKNEWGHLPPELRAEIENMLNEQSLSSMEELVNRYFTSIARSKPVREETP